MRPDPGQARQRVSAAGGRDRRAQALARTRRRPTSRLRPPLLAPFCSLLPRLEAAGVGVINASVLAMGLLTEHGPPAWHPAPPALQAAAAEAATAVRDRGLSLPRLAIKQAVLEPGIASHLVGLVSPAEVATAVGAAAEALGARPAASVREERDALEQVQAILEPVQGTTWPSGRPRAA